MRHYTIDEVTTADVQRIRTYLAEHSERSAIEDLYWLSLPAELLQGVQGEHEDCQPYCIAIEVGNHSLKFELLVRSRVNHRCGCSRYADPAQREFVIEFAENLIRTLGIRT
jgi:hypothetical protein